MIKQQNIEKNISPKIPIVTGPNISLSINQNALYLAAKNAAVSKIGCSKTLPAKISADAFEKIYDFWHFSP